MILHNHLTNKNEQILNNSTEPLTAYFCGPTVHAVSHVGHARTFSIFDSMRKYLVNKGIIVNHGMNITDIDDKINIKVRILHYRNLLNNNLLPNQSESDKDFLTRLEKLMSDEINKGSLDEHDMTPPIELYYDFVNKKSEKFWEEMKSINIDKPTITLRVSEVMPQIEDMIQSLLDKEMAYISNDSVYFDTEKYEGKFCKCQLSNSTENDMNLKSEYSGEKKNIADFALWKKEKPYFISFPSRWGNGTPGWSIECSVMSSIMFGDNIQLHGGGIDLKYPHHNNEVLQSNAHFDKSDVFKHFVYVGHIYKGGSKMAQSDKNYITIEQYLQSNSSNSMRLLFWMTSWEKPMEFTDEVIEQAKIIESKINEFISTIDYNINLNKNITQLNNNIVINEIYSNFDLINELLENGFKTNETVQKIFDIMTNTYKLIKSNEIDNTILNNILNKVINLLNIMGFKIKSNNSSNDEMFINEFIELRKELKKNKQYNLSDYIRDEMFPRMGYNMQDLSSGIKVSKL